MAATMAVLSVRSRLPEAKAEAIPLNQVLESAREIAKTDVKEIVLTGVNIGDFGIVEGKRNETLC